MIKIFTRLWLVKYLGTDDILIVFAGFGAITMLVEIIVDM